MQWPGMRGNYSTYSVKPNSYMKKLTAGSLVAFLSLFGVPFAASFYHCAAAGPNTSSPGGLISQLRLTPPPGTVLAYAGESVPAGYLECNGRELKKADYPELFAAIGNVYGGIPGATFNLPDCQSRTVVGAGQGSGDDDEGRTFTDRALGSRFGEEKHHLTVEELPTHSHPITDPGHFHEMSRVVGGSAGTQKGVLDRYVAGYFNTTKVDTILSENRAETNISVNSTGQDRPHNIMQPSIVLRWIIKY